MPRTKTLLAASLATAAALAARGALLPSGDASGATDRTSIQSAIDAAGSGGTVTLGSGMFCIDAQLMVTNGITLSGQGWDNTIIKQVSATPSAETRVVTVSGGAKVERVTLTGGRVTGPNYQFGGGACVDGGTVSWCCITNNSVSTANVKFGGGVGFKNQGAGGTVDHCIVADNSVSTSTAGDVGGGGIGGYNPWGAVTIESCLVAGNRATQASGSGRGGGIGFEFMYRGTPVTIRNTTIVGNSAGEGQTVSYGGAVFTANDSGKKLSMIDCIVAGNTTAGASTTVDVNYAGGVDWCLFDLAGDTLGANSLTGDPKFANAAAGDYTLAADSPAVAAGTAYSGIGTDLAGVVFADPPSMGCYQFGGEPPPPPIVLGEPSARPGTDYDGSVVTVPFAGEIPEGAVATAKITVGGVDYAGTVGEGTCVFEVPASAVTAGNAYAATVTLTVDGVERVADVALVQGAPSVDEDTAWIRESATAFETTGSWSGDKAAVADGAIAVSNATFSAAAPAPRAAVVTVSSTFRFGDPSDEPWISSARAAITVVAAGGVKRYAVRTADGAATNLSVVANTASPVAVTIVVDGAANTVSYSVGGVSLGTYPVAEKASGVSTVRYDGATDVAALDGAYRLEWLDANLATAGGAEYATVAEALASGAGTVGLLWDASWNPAADGTYVVATNGHALVVGGDLEWSVSDNGDGTITVTVGDGIVRVRAGSIAVGATTVRVGVEGIKTGRWYALEKTTDLSQGFVLDASTWTSASALLAGTGELEISIGENETCAFYQVRESDAEPTP